MFNPFNLNDERDFDPVDNHIINLGLREPAGNYYFCDDVIHNLNLSHRNLNLLSYNIRSVPMNLNNFLDQYLNHTELKFDVLGFCETRLNDVICSLYDIDGYTPFFNNRDSGGGGAL